MDKKTIKFKCSPDGLYQYKITKVYKKNLKQMELGTNNMITTVNENQKGYTLQQFEHAKEARKTVPYTSWYTYNGKLQVTASNEHHQKLFSDSG
jgi:hypothetical protein